MLTGTLLVVQTSTRKATIHIHVTCHVIHNGYQIYSAAYTSPYTYSCVATEARNHHTSYGNGQYPLPDLQLGEALQSTVGITERSSSTPTSPSRGCAIMERLSLSRDGPPTVARLRKTWLTVSYSRALSCDETHSMNVQSRGSGSRLWPGASMVGPGASPRIKQS